MVERYSIDPDKQVGLQSSLGENNCFLNAALQVL
jgi:hypothetical protein